MFTTCLQEKLDANKKQRDLTIDEVFNLSAGTLGVIADLMPFVPSGKREQIINSAKVQPSYKAVLIGFAKSAPDLRAEERRQFLNQLQKRNGGKPKTDRTSKKRSGSEATV